MDQTKEDAGRLGSRDAKSDEYYLQVATTIHGQGEVTQQNF